MEIRGPRLRVWRTALALAVLSCAGCLGTESGNPGARESDTNVPSTGAPSPVGNGEDFGNPTSPEQPMGVGPGAGMGAANPGGTAGTGGGSAGTGGGAGTGASSAGMGAAASGGMSAQQPSEPDDPYCPTVGPRGDHPNAPKEPCCYRASTSAPSGAPSAPERLDYRVMWSRVTNHPASLGAPRWQREHEQRQRLELESLLLRLSLPRSAGERASGAGTVRVGFGGPAASCDGRYAYFLPPAWAPHDVFSSVEVDATGTRLSLEPELGARLPLRRVPLLDPSGAGSGTELAYQGFVLQELELDNPLCLGGHGPDAWQAGGEYATFLPLEPNDSQPLPGGATLCATVGFGLGAGPRSCAEHAERCLPGSDGCPWLKLPDSLCPENELQRSLFGCHVGWADNPDGEPVSCAMPGVDAAADGSAEAVSDERPSCCDPLGADSALPACNAWLVKHEFVAGAVEIDGSGVSSVLRCGP